jgi:hypothetical protein
MSQVSIGQLGEVITRVQRGDLTSEDVQFFLDNLAVVRGLRTGALKAIPVAIPVASVAAEDGQKRSWSAFFDHLSILNPDFNKFNFPLGEDPGDEAEELCFDRVVNGYEAMAEFKRLGREGASLWAQGRYITAHPDAQREHSLLGIGAQWQNGTGLVYFPIFRWYGAKPHVDLFWLDYGFDPYYGYRFLLRKETGI